MLSLLLFFKNSCLRNYVLLAELGVLLILLGIWIRRVTLTVVGVLVELQVGP